jgi:hypothetical protein
MPSLGIGRGHGGGQNDGFARGHQCGARGLLGHAPGLKDQPLATGKLDGYFMLRHRVLVSFFRLGNLWGKAPEGERRRRGILGGRLARAKECAGERILPACQFAGQATRADALSR